MGAALLVLALVGHAFLWIGLLNRLHGFAGPPRLLKSSVVPVGLVLVLLPFAYYLWVLPPGGLSLSVLQSPSRALAAGLPYLALCWTAAGANLGMWTWRNVLHRPPPVVLHQSERPAASAEEMRAVRDGVQHHRWVDLPGNEILKTVVAERHLVLPHLPVELDGVKLIHLSDPHFTGRIHKTYFCRVVEWCNRLEPDLVALTGDLIDNVDCVEWFEETWGRLFAAWGRYFVLGNHDWRRDWRRIDRAMCDAGLASVRGRWLEVPLRDATVVLAGNELPWLGPAADLADAPPPSAEGGPVRILLSHSPDQLRWAQHAHCDLMLAGHTHGGQICLPLVGPILTPSRVGVRYASGIFHEPPTVMHVTRGVSGQFPIRWNCPPEIALLVLHAPKTGTQLVSEH